MGWQERPDTANSQLAAASDGNCRCSEPYCKLSPHWQRCTHSFPGKSGTGKKGQTLPTASWQLSVMATTCAVSPHVSPVPTSKETPSLPLENVGCQWPDTATSQLADASTGSCQGWQLATASNSNGRCSEPSCKPSSHWHKGTHSQWESGTDKKGQALSAAS